jgi:hypothetical protein
MAHDVGRADLTGEDRHRGDPSPVRRAAGLLANAVFIYVVIVEITLLIGFGCLLVGAEPSNWLAEWIYRSVERTMQPFRGMFTAIDYGLNGTTEVEPVVESAILFAIVVYGIIALAAHDLVQWLGGSRRHGTRT